MWVLERSECNNLYKNIYGFVFIGIFLNWYFKLIKFCSRNEEYMFILREVGSYF